MLALECLVSYASIGNKLSFKEIVFQMVDEEIYDHICQRIDMGNFPLINQEGALEIPYLDQLEIQSNTNNVSGINLPNLSRRDSMSTQTHNLSKAHSSNPANQLSKVARGNSSGRRIVPAQSANSIANQMNNLNKRTVSANNFNEIIIPNSDNINWNQSPINLHKQMSNIDQSDYLLPDYNFSNYSHLANNMNSFLPHLSHNNSNQYQNQAPYNQSAFD